MPNSIAQDVIDNAPFIANHPDEQPEIIEVAEIILRIGEYLEGHLTVTNNKLGLKEEQ